MAKLQQEHQEQGKISVSEVQHQIKGEIQGEEKDYSSADPGVLLLHTYPESSSVLLVLISIC